MELLIAGGIALVGYGLSSGSAGGGGRGMRPQPSRAKRLARRDDLREPGTNTAPFTREHAALAEQRWLAARDPALTGVVTPNTRLTNAVLPFFSSAKKQHTSDAVKQTLMEKFTGATRMDSSMTGTYRNKREVEAMFKPGESAARVTSAGTAGNRAQQRQDARYESGIVQNNVLPAEQLRVGRGVGVGPDVAATDGFHPMYRVMLKNVGEYKKNNLPGQVNAGASYVSSRTQGLPVAVNKNAGALVYDQERRPLLPSKAAVNAARVYPQAVPDGLQAPKLLEEDRFGNPSFLGPNLSAGLETRPTCLGGDYDDRNLSLPTLNLTGATAGVGAFKHAAFDGRKFVSQQREEPGRPGNVTGPVSRRVPSGHVLSPTQRDMTSPWPVGGVGVVRSTGETRRADAPKHTLRETQVHSQHVTGTMAAVRAGTLDNVWRYKRLGRDTLKKADALVSETPGPQRINMLAGKEALGSTALRRDDDAVQTTQPFMPTVPDMRHADKPGRRTKPLNKLPQSNPRLDFGMAGDQLRDNPYAQVRLWECA
jgi:hypothetical protein